MEIKRDFVFDPSLVLYLPLYKLDGASFMSQDAYGHLCTVTGAVWRPTGRYFDGTDDGILVPPCAALDITAYLTVIGWINAAPASGTQAVVSKYNFGDNQICWYLAGESGSSDKFKAQVSEVGDAATYKHYRSSVAVLDNSWHQVAFTWAVGTLTLFADGAEDISPTKVNDDTFTSIFSVEDNIGIGASRSSGSWQHEISGYIGEVWVYNRALTPQEIQRNYMATKWRYK